ncbi:MAG: hypothetical protein WAV25_02695 [Minisyncoccia bacterium]
MGSRTFSRDAYVKASSLYTKPGESTTARGEQEVRRTGKLNPLVDPAEFGVVRESRIRLEDREGGGFTVTVGTPVPVEYRLDTTGSMGDNVERAYKALPHTCEHVAAVLPGRDPFYCASIFGDVVDQFVLCRGQFEAEAEKMVNQLTLMVPEGSGGDTPEDPQYGLFGAAYLTNAYLQRIGLRSYDFTVTDAPMHDLISAKQLKRIFGDEVFEKLKENGQSISAKDLPSNTEIVKDLLKRAHAFAFMVGNSATHAWTSLYGSEHVILLPRIEYTPHIMAVIIGLTEGTLDLRSSKDFLTERNLSKVEAQGIIDAVAHIPLGAQTMCPNFDKLPKAGDIFKEKTDLWPIDPEDIPTSAAPKKGKKGGKESGKGGWL